MSRSKLHAMASGPKNVAWRLANTAHLPTPWRASNEPDGSGIPGWNILAADGRCACSMMDVDGEWRKLNAANARLIVEAVNEQEGLLAALRDLREACTDAYKSGRIPAEPFIRAGNVLADANRSRDSFATTPESPGGPKDANRCPSCGNENDQPNSRECSRCAEGVKP